MDLTSMEREVRKLIHMRNGLGTIVSSRRAVSLK